MSLTSVFLSEAPIPPFFIAILLLTITLVLVGVGPIAAALGGWTKLSKLYPAPQTFGGQKIRASGAMGIANYGFSLLLGADSRGLSMQTTGFVRTGHPALFVPWSDIRALEASFFFNWRVFITFSKAPEVVLRLRRETVLKLKELAGAPQAFPGIT